MLLLKHPPECTLAICLKDWRRLLLVVVAFSQDRPAEKGRERGSVDGEKENAFEDEHLIAPVACLRSTDINVDIKRWG